MSRPEEQVHTGRRARGPAVAGIAVAAIALALLACRDRSDETKPRGPARPEEVERFLTPWAIPESTGIDAESGYPKSVRRTADGMRMLLIPAGTFWMGSKPHAPLEEMPRHRVTLTRPYYLDETEVTVGMWRRFVPKRMPDLRYRGRQGGIPEGGLANEHPISNVELSEVLVYLAWAGVSLPTEAQWERAARGGHEDREYPWGDEDDDTRHSTFETLYVKPVKSYPPNDFGLYDMSGNVSEWCADGFHSDWYAKSPSTDPIAPPSDSRVIRGGSWGNNGSRLRCASRDSFGPGGFSIEAPFTKADLDKLLPSGGVTVSSLNVGFRCAKTVP